jgi:hypothetical protein
VALAGETPLPVMVQFDVVVDPAELEVDAAVVPLRSFDRLEANLVAPGRLRVVCGDATGRPGAELAAGGLVEVPVRVVVPGATGPFTVRLEAIVASDADGGTPEFDAAPREARVQGP